MNTNPMIVARSSWNVAATGALTQQDGVANALYPVSRAVDRDPATATKSTTTDDYALQWDWTLPQRVDGVWIPMYNMPAGTVVHFQLDAGASWAGSPATAPTVDATVTVPAYGGDLPRGLFLNITEAAGYSASGFRYGRLYVPNPSQVTAIGEIFIASQIATVPNILIGATRPRGRAVTMHQRNDGGYFKYDRGHGTWQVNGRVYTDADEFADYLAIFEDARGSLYPFAIVINVDEANPEGYVVQWEGEFSPSNMFIDQEELSFTWQMVPRGRAL